MLILKHYVLVLALVCELPARMRNQNSCYSLGIEVGNQPLPPGFSLNV